MKYQVAYKKENRMQMPSWGDFTLRGEVGNRIDQFIMQSVTSEHFRKDILKEAENCFRDQEDDQELYGLWRCEFWGKLMLSAVRVCRMKQDEAFKDFLRESVYALLRYQREDGYLNTYKDSRNVIPMPLAVIREKYGMNFSYNWNIWGRKYTLWGLIEAAELLDDTHILECADRMATEMLEDLDALGVQFQDTGVMSGMPSCSVMKPLLILYRLTGKQRYLDECLKIADFWENGSCPALIRNGLASTAPSNWYERSLDPDYVWIAKAYEMMSCYDGLCELYRVTGERTYLEAVEGFWEALIKYESNILGSVSYCERFANAVMYANASTEICDVIHWMRLCHELYALTGQSKYMDAFERAFLNAFLAGLFDDHASCAGFIRSHGRHYRWSGQCGTRYQHCCLNNLPRGFVNAAQSAASRQGNSYFVNLYIPSEVHFPGMLITVGEGYTTTGRVQITAEADQSGKTIFLRIPDWSRETFVTVPDGQILSAPCASWLSFALNKGRNILTVQFDMTTRVIDFHHPVVEMPENDYHVRRWKSGNEFQNVDQNIMLRHAMSSVQRGPVILARSKKIGCSEWEMFSQETVCGQHATAECSEVHQEPGFLCRCKIRVKTSSGEKVFEMCDFSSAGNCITDDKRFFTLFI